MLEKAAEHRSRVPPLAKSSVTTSCQSSDGWMFEKTVKVIRWRGTEAFNDYAQSVIQALNINQILREQTRLQYSAVE